MCVERIDTVMLRACSQHLPGAHKESHEHLKHLDWNAVHRDIFSREQYWTLSHKARAIHVHVWASLPQSPLLAARLLQSADQLFPASYLEPQSLMSIPMTPGHCALCVP